ncbi:unnamed protein product, partial [Thlaspi arvense]
ALSQLISLLSHKISLGDSVDSYLESSSLMRQTLKLKPQPELMLLIHQIIFLAYYMNSKLEKLISLCPQVQVALVEGKIQVYEEVLWSNNRKWYCLPGSWDKFRSAREDATHFLCRGCRGKNHERYGKAPVEIKHPLHPKHSLQLVLLYKYSGTRECHCCGEDLIKVFYYCSTCDAAMNIDCVEKPPVLSIDHPKWHDHALALFPRQASLTCNACALSDSSSPIYMCPPCDFVIHLKCTLLPRVIRISRHLHRICSTLSFDQGEWSCGVCRTKIENDYGGYSCIKNDCYYAAHSRCTTQSNVWDGLELEGEPEEIEEIEVKPFVRISDGIIQYFSHQHHHLRLDKNTGRDYNENKQCQACVMPIYFECLKVLLNFLAKSSFLIKIALSQLISLLSHKISLGDSVDSYLESSSLMRQTLNLKPQPELMLLIHQIIFLAYYMNSKLEKLISLCPQVQVALVEGKFQVHEEVPWSNNRKWYCLPGSWDKFRSAREDATHFLCRGCRGKNHERYGKAPVEIKHPFHPKHSLQLILLYKYSGTRECHCCGEDLIKVFYYCSTCDAAMNIDCVEKPPVLSIDHPKWHDHALALFPRRASLTCNACALSDSSSPIYMCPPCDFVIHLKCTLLPLKLFVRISDGIIQYFSHQHHHLRLDKNLISLCPQVQVALVEGKIQVHEEVS